VPTVVEISLRDHAVNVLKVAFFFRRLLAEDYPPDNRDWYMKPLNAMGRKGRQFSHQIVNLFKSGEAKPFKQTEHDIGVEAREEIKE
jgi:hypothetical protein